MSRKILTPEREADRFNYSRKMSLFGDNKMQASQNKMELQQFVKDALIAIQNGCQEGATDKTKARSPVCYKEGAEGIEFDVGVLFDDGKICVKGIGSDCTSRIRFFVPIVGKKE